MKFSIITPGFNGLSHLRQCVGSVRGQCGVDREHRIIDGVSSDGSVEWLKANYGVPSIEHGLTRPKDAGGAMGGEGANYRISWFSEPDAGMYDAINKGWARAQGDVLSWLNCDEQYLSGTLTRVAQAFAEHPRVDVVFGRMLIVGPDGQPLAVRKEIPLRALYVRNGFLYAPTCAMFFRRQLWDEGLLRLDAQYRYAADMDLMLRLLAAGKKVRHLPVYLSLFGVDGGNLSSTQSLNMEAEAESIRRRYGAWLKPLRPAARLLRCLERFARGCYRSEIFSYDFALDEQPAFKRIPPTRIGFRFTYARAARILLAQSPVNTK